MTANQINYWKTEWDRNIRQGQLYEDIRHNKATEQLNKQNLAETKRQNIAWTAETKRHNLENEYLSALGLKVQNIQAGASVQSAAAAQTSAAAAYKQAQVRAAELEQQKWVDQQTQSRLDKLAEAEYAQTMAKVSQIETQNGLITMQTITEANRAGLITAQTAEAEARTALDTQRTKTERANTAYQWVSTVNKGVDTAKDVVNLYTGLAGIIYEGG